MKTFALDDGEIKAEPMGEGLRMLFAGAARGSVAQVQAHAGLCHPRLRNAVGCTPLMLASQFGDRSCVEALLPKSDAAAADRRGNTALMFASKMGHAAVVELLLPLSRVDDVDIVGETALLHAAKSGSSADCARMLLAAGADSTRSAAGGMTALHWAAVRGSADMVDVLLPRSNPSATNGDGFAPGDLAAKAGRHDIARKIDAAARAAFEREVMAKSSESCEAKARSRSL